MRVVSPEHLHAVPDDEDERPRIRSAVAGECEGVLPETEACCVWSYKASASIGILKVGEFLDHLKEVD